jgi:hypothetical protein
MRVVRVWINSEDSVNILTDVSTKDINTVVTDFKKNQDAITETLLERYLFRAFPGAVTIIPRDIEDNEILLNA